MDTLGNFNHDVFIPVMLIYNSNYGKELPLEKYRFILSVHP